MGVMIIRLIQQGVHPIHNKSYRYDMMCLGITVNFSIMVEFCCWSLICAGGCCLLLSVPAISCVPDYSHCSGSQTIVYLINKAVYLLSILCLKLEGISRLLWQQPHWDLVPSVPREMFVDSRVLCWWNPPRRESTLGLGCRKPPHLIPTRDCVKS